MTDSLQDFKPTSVHINALPDGLRKYIHDLESLCDPAGIVAENTTVKDMLLMLGATNARLRAKVKVAGKLADALRTVIYTNALEESDCLAGVEVLKEWNALRECGEGE